MARGAENLYRPVGIGLASCRPRKPYALGKNTRNDKMRINLSRAASRNGGGGALLHHGGMLALGVLGARKARPLKAIIRRRKTISNGDRTLSPGRQCMSPQR